jgi:excisionase family DNA binding protein
MAGDTDRMAIEALRVFVRQVVREAIAESAAAAPRPEGFIGTAEAARRAGVKQDTILSWISRDILPAARIEGARGWKIRPTDLDAVLSGKHTGAPPADPVDLAGERARRLAASIPRGGGKH